MCISIVYLVRNAIKYFLCLVCWPGCGSSCRPAAVRDIASCDQRYEDILYWHCTDTVLYCTVLYCTVLTLYYTKLRGLVGAFSVIAKYSRKNWTTRLGLLSSSRRACVFAEWTVPGHMRTRDWWGLVIINHAEAEQSSGVENRAANDPSFLTIMEEAPTSSSPGWKRLLALSH